MNNNSESEAKLQSSPVFRGESELGSNTFQKEEHIYFLWLAEKTSRNTFPCIREAIARPKTSTYVSRAHAETHTQKSDTPRSN